MKRPDPLLNITEAAEYSGQTVRWMRRAVTNRWIPFVKMGGRIHFQQSDLDAYVASRTVPAASDK